MKASWQRVVLSYLSPSTYVVEENHAVCPQQLQALFVVLFVRFFVGVDEGEVEFAALIVRDEAVCNVNALFASKYYQNKDNDNVFACWCPKVDDLTKCYVQQHKYP